MSEDWGPGYVIGEKYRLTSKLGEGGMGAVWRADHLTLNAPVAVKLLDPTIANTAEGLERFNREAQSAAALRSAHVVQTFDYGVHEKVPFIVMELLVGESLAERLASKGPMPPGQVASLLKQVSRAITKAHQQGIVHRDLKPDNVFLVEGDEDEPVAKVLDFGIAKSTNVLGSTSTGSKTRTGALLGTPYYMSPEQAQGIKEVDYRSDLWALAVITYECVSGKRPFDSEALGDLLLKICASPMPVPSQNGVILSGFDQWFARAASRDPAGRFGTASEMAKAFEAMLDPSKTSADSYRSLAPSRFGGASPLTQPAGDSLEGSEVAPLSARTQNRRMVFAATVGALVLVVGVLAVVLARSGREEKPALAAPPVAAAPPVTAAPPAPSPVPAPVAVAPPPVPEPSVAEPSGDEPRPGSKKRAGSSKTAKVTASKGEKVEAPKPAAPSVDPAKKQESFDPLLMRR